MQADPQLLQILGAAERRGAEEVHHLGVSCVLLRGNQRDVVLTTNPAALEICCPPMEHGQCLCCAVPEVCAEGLGS